MPDLFTSDYFGIKRAQDGTDLSSMNRRLCTIMTGGGYVGLQQLTAAQSEVQQTYNHALRRPLFLRKRTKIDAR
jgi:hypothetical protein